MLVTQAPLRQFTFVSITPVKIDAWRCDWKIAVAMCDYTRGSQPSHVSSMGKLYISSKKEKRNDLINYIYFWLFFMLGNILYSLHYIYLKLWQHITFNSV